MVRALLLLSTLMLFACSERAATEVHVHFEAEPGIRATATSLRVRIYAAGSADLRYDETRPVDATAMDRHVGTVPVVPLGGDASRRFDVRAELLDSAMLSIDEVESLDEHFVEHALREITLVFDGALAGDAGIDATAPDAGSDAGSCECPCASDACVAGACVPSRRIAAVGTGADHTCVVDEDGALSCWGRNGEGQVGIGTTDTPVLTPTVVASETVWSGTVSTEAPLAPFSAVDLSIEFTCGLTAGNAPYCWGRNRWRQLGLGSCCAVATGDQTRPTILTSGGSMRRISTGGEHACGISEAGWLYCWGHNDAGQTSDVASATYSVPRRVGSDGDWLEVSAGTDHSCGIRAFGPASLYCWGEADDGRLGRWFMNVDQYEPQRLTGTFVAVSAGNRHTCVITTDGRLQCFGRNAEGQLGTADTTQSTTPVEVDGAHTDWSSVSAGYTHTCGIRGDRLFCWGTNLSGELGVAGAAPLSPSPVEVGSGYTSVSVGESYTCAVTTDAHVACWGSGASGKLGSGDTMDSPTPRVVCL